MTAGSLLGLMMMLVWAGVGSVAEFLVVQIGIGVAGAASLYEAAFAVVVRSFPPDRRAAAVVTVTVVAGFASSIFLPLTGWLVALWGWRRALVILAGIYALTVPVHALAVPAATPSQSSEDGRVRRRATLSGALRDRPFWLIVAGFTMQSTAVGIVSVHLVGALSTWHRPAFAASIAGLSGVLSVSGRLLIVRLGRRYPISVVTSGVFAVQAVNALLLPVLGASTIGAVITVVGIGLGLGVGTIARPVLLTQRYDTVAYATLAGVVTVPTTVAVALAPLLAAEIRSVTGSYRWVLVMVGACCFAAAVSIALVGGHRRDPDHRSRDTPVTGDRRRPPA